MSLQSLRLLFLSSLGCSLFFGNAVTVAQVVVPTVPSGSTTVPSGSTTVPSGSTTTTIPNSTTVNSSTRFSCQSYNGQFIVMYQPQSQPGQYFAWAAPQNLGGGWDTQKRCQAIAGRLELYRADGLQELQIAVENNENIICVTTEAQPNCRIVLTVPRGKDPYAVRNSVFQNLTTADSGQQTIVVDTYTDRQGGNRDSLYNIGQTLIDGNNQLSSSRSGINLKPYLDPQDGGTAKKLRNGVGIRQNTQQKGTIRLNPGRFR
ncbi:COP23 domain-containing protein [Dolichospermum circinale]|uniref:COP23 domain-containing protein n=1 Tax=Dolichospermum circinale TaxID=109265 RepID=UPI00232CFF51|nr:COP23 domain-containing protein [Dolichospermum circinale]MDB9452862.1 COP23 domain-containing protein [Dolichospermum circinale CS-541/06]MDB9462716.1 COP23 domain-containing protein [Dolichospermum circinale CS-541/04]MDB9549275.1 COP23 domain-containing protein [Dolichospermum circinale CS-1031]